MKIINYAVCMLALIAIGFAGCKKHSVDESHRAPVDHCTGPENQIPITDLKLLGCKFKTGTQWIMRDTIKHTFDTICVASANVSFVQISTIPSDCNRIEQHQADVSFHYVTQPVHLFMDVISDRVVLLNNNAGFYDNSPNVIFSVNKPTVDSVLICNTWFKNVFQSDTLRLYSSAVDSYFFIQTLFNSESGF